MLAPVLVAALGLTAGGCYSTPDSQSSANGSTSAMTDGAGDSTGGESTADETTVTPMTSAADSTTSAGTANTSSSSEDDETSSSGAPEPQVLLDDTFDAGLEGWLYLGHPGFSLNHDVIEGDSAPSIRIDGDCPSPPAGMPCLAGAAKVVDLSSWTEGPLVLSFSHRATSTDTSSTVTNAHLQLYDADTGRLINTYGLVAGGVTDSGWNDFDHDIGPAVAGVTHLQIYLLLSDGWAIEYMHTARFDNILLVAG